MTKQITSNEVDKSKIAIGIMAIVILIGGAYYFNDFKTEKQIRIEEQKQIEENQEKEQIVRYGYNAAVAQIYNLSDGCQVLTVSLGTSTPKQLVDVNCITEKQIITPPEPIEPEENN